MAGPHSSYIPKGPSEIIDYLAMMMLSSPTFIDRTGLFYDRNIETTFAGLNEGLRQIHHQLDEEMYLTLRKMSDSMRAYFEADLEGEAEDCRKGREIIVAMRELLKRISARRNKRSSPTFSTS
jgi:hypothetical protein